MTTKPAKAETEEPVLLRRDEGGVATLTLNRPQARNALNRGLMDALGHELEAIAADGAVKVVVVTAQGPVFCAGHDLKELRAEASREAYEALFTQCSRLMLAITRLKKPVIASVQGMATAAGCQLVAACDLAVVSTAARFATPGVNIGLFCSTPMVALSRAVGRKQAMEMLLTGEAVTAEEAKSIGLVNRVVPPETLETATAELASEIAAKSPFTLAVGKEAFYRQIEMGLEEAYAYTNEVMTRNMLSRDAEEGVDAFLEKRPPAWRGC